VKETVIKYFVYNKKLAQASPASNDAEAKNELKHQVIAGHKQEDLKLYSVQEMDWDLEIGILEEKE